MKGKQVFYILAGSLMLTGCQQQCSDIVCETYVHRYGVPLAPEDWSDRGQHGQVISTRKDGVVICKNYESGILHGETTYTFAHKDVIEKKEIYDQGNLAQVVFYYPSGMPQKQITFEPPQTEKVLTWYESGAPQSKELYFNGLLAQGEYLNPSQQQESAVIDQNGLRTLRDDYGQLLSIDEIQNGQMILRRTFHANGAPASVTPYVNNVIQGKRWTYQKGGEPATIEEWNNNCQHGNTQVFENGEKVSDLPYVYGQIHGVEQRYRNSDQLVQENNWVKGCRHGPSYTYVNDTTHTDWYFKDRKVNRGTYEALSNQ
jgi:antitoxin component YwqK of YwqJK toxin-antitoxin module